MDVSERGRILVHILIEEGISEVVFHSLEEMLFCNEGTYLALGIHVLHNLVQGGRHNVISVDPWSSKQEVV